MDLASLRRAWALAALLIAAPALAQGTLTGTVVDADLGETLPGANVLVVEAGTGAATTLDGTYRVARLAAGTYTVRASFAGFQTQTVTGVSVRDGETTTLHLRLSAGTLTEVVVSAEAILATNSDVGLDRVRARAVAVSDAISAETISQAGASTAGDAMERVTGASVQGGRYVYVRGLGDRYAATQLNGSTLPTADPDRRAVPFDLFPSAFLENIVTLKTFTPDRPGSFSGGLVDITTRSFPTEFTASVAFSSGANSTASPGSAILVDPASELTFFGGARALSVPAELLDGRPFPFVARQEVFNPDTPAGQERLAAIEANERLVDHFSARPVAPAAGTAQAPYSLSASVGNRVPLFGRDLGFILGLTADRGVGAYEEGTVGRYDVSGAGSAPRLRQSRLDQRATVEASFGGMGSLFYRLSPRHEIGVNGLVSRSAETQARVISGPAPLPIGGEGDTTTFVTDRVMGYTERALTSGQAIGRHDLGGVRAEWRASLARTRLDEPDLRFFANARTESGLQIGGASLSNTLHFFRESAEDLGGLALALTVPPRALAGLPVQVRVGGLVERTQRDFRERRFEVLSEGLVLAGEDAAAVDSLYSPANSGVVSVRPANPFDPQQRATYVLGNRLVDGTQPNNQYDGALGVTAGYAMIEVPVTRALRVIGGARVERTDLGIDVVDLVTGEPLPEPDSTQTGRIATTDWLPSLNLVYALSERMNLRAAATRTLARPTFREIAPFESFDFATDGPLLGNPGLDRTRITNLDLRWEWFNRPGAVVAASGYYKHLARPIERVIVDIENNVNQFANVDRATIWGAEVEARQALGAFTGAPVLRHLHLGANLTLTRSAISIGAAELAERRLVDPGASDVRPLQGQSPFLVNLDVSYETDATTVGLYYNVFGRRLSRVGIPDVYEDPSPQLDFVASRRLVGDLTLKLTARNLLGSRQQEVYDFPESTWGAIGGRAPVYQRTDLGRSLSLSLTFRPRLPAAMRAASAAPAEPSAQPLAETAASTAAP